MGHVTAACTPRLARWLGPVGEVSVGTSGLTLSGVADPWLHEDTVGVTWTKGVIWGDLLLKRSDGLLFKATLSKFDGAAIAEVVTARTRSALRRKLIELSELHQQAASQLRGRLSGQNYLRAREARRLLDGAASQFKPFASHPLLLDEDIQALTGEAQWWVRLVRDQPRAIAESNELWIRREMERHKEFFDEIGTKGLTEEQRRACIVVADRALVSAAAGSGKTSMLVGKVGYLLKAGHARPEEILLLAFNKSAAKEIGDRIKRDLAPVLRGGVICAGTFHAFGLEVLGQTTGKRPAVYDHDREGGELVAWSNMIDGLSKEDPRFGIDWWLFRALYLKSAADPAAFMTLEEWQEYVDQQGDWTADRRKGFLTLKGEIVKSQGELAIANWLALNGVPYEYERPYEYETADKSRRQYHPDFYLPAIRTYIEHFALDERGHPPPAFGDEYAQSMEWKRLLHRDKGTRLIETTFAQFVNGTLFVRLEQALRQAGQTLQEMRKSALLEVLKEQQERAYPIFLMSVVRPFVSHAKNNRIPIESVEDGTLAREGTMREKLFCRLMARLMRYYDSRLRANNLVDFDDMILLATDAVVAGRYRSPFKAVLVDEFQDISQARAALVKALVDQRDDSMLMCVGDARQAIYRFAGSDVSVFRHFDSLFGSAVTLQLTKTFRFNQGIADISSAFVGERDAKVVSDVPDRTQVLRVRLYANRQELAKATNAALKEIADEVRAKGYGSASVLVLFRVNAIGRALGELQTFGVLQVTTMSIHRSKGLEADYVVVAGVVGSGSGAFPSKIADDELLQLVMPDKEPGLAEERRLMYVALTRGRRAAYVVASASPQSEFVSELIGMEKATTSIVAQTIDGQKTRLCEVCGRGHLVLRKGRFGEFLGCSRFPRCKGTVALPAEGSLKDSSAIALGPMSATPSVSPRTGARPLARQSRRSQA
jgi:DNA helicase-4